MITGIAHTAVTVKDMDESIRFYTQVLGFKKAFSIPHYVSLGLRKLFQFRITSPVNPGLNI